MIDHVEQAESRIYWQYRTAPKAIAWFKTLPEIAQEDLEKALESIANLLDLDAITGDQLDVVGRIVGLDRPPVEETAETSTTQMATDDLAPQLGESGPQLQATKTTISKKASDELLRVLIKSKIERNTSRATINNVVIAARFITGASVVEVNDNQDMTWSVLFGSNLDDVTRFALNTFDLLPRPQGTRFLGFIENPTFTQLGAAFAQMGDERAQLNEVFV